MYGGISEMFGQDYRLHLDVFEVGDCEVGRKTTNSCSAVLVLL